MALPGSLVSCSPAACTSAQEYQDGIGGSICNLCFRHVAVLSNACTLCYLKYGIKVDAVGRRELLCVFHGRRRGRFRCGFIGCYECACNVCRRFHHSDHFESFCRRVPEDLDCAAILLAYKTRRFVIATSLARLPRVIILIILEFEKALSVLWGQEILKN